MDRQEIAEKILTILEANPQSISTFYSTLEQSEPSEAAGKFSNEYVELLLQLESRIHEHAVKEFFWQLLGISFASSAPTMTGRGSGFARTILKVTAQVRKHCDCAFMTYLKAGKTDQALDGLLSRLKNYSSVNDANNAIAFCLYQVLLVEPHLFSDPQMKTIESIVRSYGRCLHEASSWHKKKAMRQSLDAKIAADPLYQVLQSTVQSTPDEKIPLDLPPTDLIPGSQKLVSKLEQRLKRVKFLRLREELKGVSTEVNQDKKELVRRYEDLGFNTELTEALENIDKEIEETGSKFSYSKSIGFVRNVYEESLRQIAIRIRDATHKNIPKWTGKGKMGEAIDYFRSIRFISDKEKNMLTGFSGFVSDTGSHSLTSEQYELRIAKNILVEICSYLTDKLDEFLS